MEKQQKVNKLLKIIEVIFIILLGLSGIVFISSRENCWAQKLKLHFIDVGEGDAILIQTPHDKAILIDSGNLISGYKVLEFLRAHNVSTLEYLIFTHPHPDHIGGGFLLFQALSVIQVCDNGYDLQDLVRSDDFYRWYHQLVRDDPRYSVLTAPRTLLIDGVELNVLWPFVPFLFNEMNSNSLVILVNMGSFRCLLAGDLTLPAEQALVRKGFSLQARVLKVGHHGYDDASSEEFLNAVSPEWGIISVDDANIRGYPSPDVLARLQKHDIKVHRTDKEGDITFIVEKQERETTMGEEWDIQVITTHADIK